MGLYIKATRVEALLEGKVKFTDNPEDRNALSRASLAGLIDEAEAQVELDLSPRYAAPFCGEDGSSFEKLPRSSQRFIRLLCELMAQIRVLETSFGTGSAMNGKAYTEPLQKRYDEYIKKGVERTQDGEKRFGAFVYPPLLGLSRNWHNRASDDGFGGMVLSASMGNQPPGWPGNQIQDPSESWLNFNVEDGCE